MLEPKLLDHSEAERLGVTKGWWAVDEWGQPVFGPYPSREAVLVHIAEKRGVDAVKGG